MAASKSLTPTERIARAKKAGRAAHSVDAHIRALVEKAPPLTADQRAKLQVLLASS